MARGAKAKVEIFEKLLATFPDSFMYNNGKELRINWMEEDTPVQIKVALTCAKEVVSPEGEVLKAAAAVKEEGPFKDVPEVVIPEEPTQEEKQNVEDLLKSLGLV